VQLALPDPCEQIAAVHQGLGAAIPHIAPRFFYDELGSRLFTAITALPEYYPTRTEAQLLRQHLPAIVAAAPVQGATLVDLGAGNCEKAASLFAAVHPQRYVAVDISVEFLRESLDRLQRLHPGIDMVGVGTDFSQQLELPPTLGRHRRLFFYPGSSIGNFTPDDAVAFLRSVLLKKRAQPRIALQGQHHPVDPHRAGFAGMVRTERWNHLSRKRLLTNQMANKLLQARPCPEKQRIHGIHHPQATGHPADQRQRAPRPHESLP
jgi:hypothetical protein